MCSTVLLFFIHTFNLSEIEDLSAIVSTLFSWPHDHEAILGLSQYFLNYFMFPSRIFADICCAITFVNMTFPHEGLL